MARLRSGILGNVRGKVGGVVGGQWKDKNYIREYVKPANPDTVLQQAQRSKMSAVVALAKPLVGPIFRVYTDRFLKTMSGFNRFVADNIALAPAFVDPTLITLTSGNIYSPAGLSGSYNDGTGVCSIGFSTALGSDGLATDKIYCAVYNHNTGLWYFAGAEVARSAGSITVTLPNSISEAVVGYAYLFAARYKNSLLTNISTSSVQVVELA